MATITVNSLADNLTSGDSLVTLREAIIAANGDTSTDLGATGSGADTIVLPAGTFQFALGGGGEDMSAMGDLDISSDITIRGQGIDVTTIDGRMLDAVFNVLGAGSLTLENLTVTDGEATADNNTFTPAIGNAPRGNAISVLPGGVLNLTNSQISGNAITDDDAVILNYNGTVTLDNATISGHNGSASSAHLIQNIGSGGGTATFNVINNSTISGNTIGGNNQSYLIYNDGDNGTINMTFRDSTISGNATTGTRGKFLYSKSRGGGTGNLTIDNTNILNNSTSGTDADFLHFDASSTNGTFQLTNSTVSGNTTSADRSTFLYLRAQNDGAVVNSTISGTTFDSNATTGNYGDFLVHTASGSLGGLSTTLTSRVTNSTFTNNTFNASYSDGFLNQTLGRDSQATVTFWGVTISGNSAGGDLFVNQARNADETVTINITDTAIANNQVNQFGSGGSTFDANPAAGTPGTLNLNVMRSTISGTSGGNGSTFNTTNTGDLNIDIIDSTISGNSTTANGGAIQSTIGADITVTNSTISGNSTADNGGAIAVLSGAAISLNNATIAGNMANQGGGIYAEAGATVNVNNSIVVGNTGTNPDVSGTFNSNGANIIGDPTGSTSFGVDITNIPASNAIDVALANNGGPTQTHALIAGSPAINASMGGTATDQRGIAAFGTRDIGAFETQTEIDVLNRSTSIPDGSTLSLSTPVGSTLTVPLTVRNDGIDTLTLIDPISLTGDAQLSLVSTNFTTTTLAAGASTTFALQLDATTAGTFTGNLSFGNNDLDENPYNFAITATVENPTVGNPPENTVPTTALVTDANTDLSVSGISVADADGGNLEVTLTASNGTLTLGSTTGLTFTTGDGTQDASLTFSGIIADLNTALSNLTFTPATNFSGDTSFTILTRDGLFSDTDSVAITVNALASPPSTSTPDPVVPENDSNPVTVEPDICPLVNNPPTFPFVNSNTSTQVGTENNDLVVATVDGETVETGGGNDLIIALDGNDNLIGGNGEDTLSGNEGNDAIEGGAGVDIIFAGKDTDGVRGGDGDDSIAGNIGSDILEGNGENDLIFGNTGEDYIDGGTGDDVIHGGRDNDRIIGGEGNDIVLGEIGNDCLHGDGGNDVLFGNTGADILYGNDENDSLWGGRDNDSLMGGVGDDVLVGDLGDDSLMGGEGNDIFVLKLGDGSDVIVDFESGDRIGLAEGLTFADLILSQSGNDVTVSFNNELLGTITSVSLSTISSDRFTAI
ncbi:MAG: hypothetical protein J7641_00630 [Cyanobacteria bacterium SID2]|nr:hypothetical protein [Cyanobacteria bacterium SID2]